MKKSNHKNNKKQAKREASTVKEQINLELSELEETETENISSEPLETKSENQEETQMEQPQVENPQEKSTPLGDAFEKAYEEAEEKSQNNSIELVKGEIKKEKNNSKSKKFFKKQSVVFAITVIACVLVLILGAKYVNSFEKIHGNGGGEGIKAEVTRIVTRLSAAQDLEGFQKGDGVNIIFEAKLLSGSNEGKTVKSVQSWDPHSIVPIKEVEVGDKVLLLKNAVSDSNYNLIFADYIRFDGLFWFILAFFGLLILFGQSKGVRTITSLLLTFGAIFGVFLPSVLAGKNVYVWAIGISSYIIVMTMVVAIGYSRKSFCAGLGCVAGSVFCGFLVKFANKALMLSGLGSDEAAFLVEVAGDKTIDLNGIIFAAIIIGAVGAIMDVSMSISSSLYELKEKSPNLSSKEILYSGFSIGKDIMGTMANTLILAYIGSSLTMTLLMMAYNDNLTLLLNKETLIVEILQAVAGSIAILITIPLTSIICAVVYSISKSVAVPFENKTPLLESGDEAFSEEDVLSQPDGVKVVPVGAVSPSEEKSEKELGN